MRHRWSQPPADLAVALQEGGPTDENPFHDRYRRHACRRGQCVHRAYRNSRTSRAGRHRRDESGTGHCGLHRPGAGADDDNDDEDDCRTVVNQSSAPGSTRGGYLFL